MTGLRSILAAGLLFGVAGCGKDTPAEQSWPGFVPSREQIEAVLTSPEVPPQAYDFEAELRLLNFSVADEQKVDAAVDLIKRVVASPEFKDEVLAFRYDGKEAFVDNNGMSNAEIYLVILEGAEKLTPSRNRTMDAELELYYANNNIIGYTYPHTTRIWMNTKYFKSYNASHVAQNLFHEWLHKLGFGHATSWSSARDASVPYAIGRMIGRHARALH